MASCSCGSCCTSMSTANPNPSVCQTCGSDGGASCVQSLLNTFGKLGVSVGAAVSGRPVTMNSKGVTVGPSASYSAAAAQGYLPIIIIVGIVVVTVAVLFMHKG